MGITAAVTFLVAGAAVGVIGGTRALAARKSAPKRVALCGSGVLGIAGVYLLYTVGWAALLGHATPEYLLPEFLSNSARRGILWAYGAAAAGLGLMVAAGIGRLLVRRRRA